MSNGQYPPSPPASPPPKTGLPGWAKILIGCGCLALVIAGAALFYGVRWGANKVSQVSETLSDPAKLAAFVIEQNPDLEVVENNTEAGTIKVRVKSTGEVNTYNYADITAGKFTVQDKDGKTILDTSQVTEGGNIQFTGPDGQKVNIGSGGDLPSWIPLYPNVTETSKSGEMATGDNLVGLASQKTTDSVDTVKTYYQGFLPGDGYTVNSNLSTGAGDNQVVLINATKNSQTVNIAIGTSGGQTYVTINYQGPK
jgi:hypothetical protein